MRLVGAVLVVLLATPAGATPAKAKQLNAEGMKEYKNKRYDEARGRFERAVAEDETMVVAHYNLASMAALLHDPDTVVDELGWLKASSDPAAAAKLVKGKTDPDLTPVSTHPKVRELLGLPAFDTLSPEAKLLERGGAWSGTDMGCASAWLEIKLAKGGKHVSRYYCHDFGETTRSTGTWSVDAKGLHLVDRGIDRSRLDYEFGPCGSENDPGEPGNGSVCLIGPGIELSRGPH